MTRHSRAIVATAAIAIAAFVTWRRWRGPWPITPQPVWPAPPSDETEPAWVDPIDGECPPGYPVKVSTGGVVHPPSGRSYARTRPVRCYRTTELAELDGYRLAQA
jgi:hypothetical protein